jgi:hypothetical protein
MSSVAGWLVVVFSLASNWTAVPALPVIHRPSLGSAPSIQFWTAEVTSMVT